jgi:hypothetical protein
MAIIIAGQSATHWPHLVHLLVSTVKESIDSSGFLDVTVEPDYSLPPATGISISFRRINQGVKGAL